MNFASVQFWVIGILGFLILKSIQFVCFRKNSEFDQIALCILGVTLLASESVLTLSVFLYVLVITHCCERVAARCSSAALIGLIAALLTPLIYFKYSDFLFGGLNSGNVLSYAGIIPMGISFYSFQAIAYLVDGRREFERKGKLSKNSFLTKFNFLGFFPQIVAGPIERRQSLLPQIEKFKFGIIKNQLSPAIHWIVLGLFFKLVLADNLAGSTNAIDREIGGLFAALFVMLGNTFRIYFDFAGYSFVAIGLGRLFGISLTLNFLSPYLAISPRDFWRRWHISLSQWLRDYIYIPLGGSRTRFHLLAILAVFIISGLWHGAGWNFIFWGFLHGIGVVIWSLLRLDKIPKVCGWAITQMFIVFTWIPFFDSSLSGTIETFSKVFSPSSWSVMWNTEIANYIQIFGSRGDFLLFLALLIFSIGILILEWLSVRKKGDAYKLFINDFSCFLMVVSIVVLGSSSEGEFVYFNF